MKYKINLFPRTLHFKQPAGTSRGIYLIRNVWYIQLIDIETGCYGIGECAPLPNLSCDDIPDYKTILSAQCNYLKQHNCPDYATLYNYPSILFGIETALQHLHAGSLRLWDTSFSQGLKGIPINGLIWMGNSEEMLQRINEKIQAGFHCIKLKIGAINFEDELKLLTYIRRKYPPEDIEIRVDANGAFTPEEALSKIERLYALGIHSIEQPIRAGQWSQMAELCKQSDIPIALDEELIGINRLSEKIELLKTIRPKFIILKPSLHGGFSGTKEWINCATQQGIGWWITSALESNIGLNAIAQWCATLETNRPQGLGTGLLFTDNIHCPLYIQGEKLWFHPEEKEPDLQTWLNS
ncbi:MAG TPA: o-succinylbenzoate synthase [Candidatus Phocaeicola gallistercoris]|nr:o-succinylbenzoate synthase [Candidatus Phocaeicola gallistercoris]